MLEMTSNEKNFKKYSSGINRSSFVNVSNSSLSSLFVRSVFVQLKLVFCFFTVLVVAGILRFPFAVGAGISGDSSSFDEDLLRVNQRRIIIL
jgi:hypothetical protein